MIPKSSSRFLTPPCIPLTIPTAGSVANFRRKVVTRAEPYSPLYAVKGTADEARKIFKLPDRGRSFDKSSKPCLNYRIGICDAPCRGGTHGRVFKRENL